MLGQSKKLHLTSRFLMLLDIIMVKVLLKNKKDPFQIASTEKLLTLIKWQ